MRISEETRIKVLEAARQLDYHPDITARRLVTGKTGLLAYVERQPTQQAFADATTPQVLRGLHDAAVAAGYEVLFAPIPIEDGNGRVERLIAGRHVDGIIVSGPRTDDDEIRRMIEAGAPIVLQGTWPGLTVTSVDIDNFTSAKIAAEHLVSIGYRRIGIIAHASMAYSAAQARHDGFLRGLADSDADPSTVPVAVAGFSPDSGAQAMETLLRQDELEAVFVSSDTVAIGAMRAARDAGRRIPQDLAVVGFDDIPIAVHLDPALTTVRLPAYGIGWGAAELTIRLVQDDQPRKSQLVLDTELIVRESCGALTRPPPD